MNSDVLCVYYSRTGHTRETMEEIAQALEAELVEVTDGVDRSGPGGALRSGLDAMRRTTRKVKPFETKKPLEQYRLVILGSPIWAGRCCSVIRGFLKEYGERLENVGYVVTRGTEERNEDVFDQMDLYVPNTRQVAVSLRSKGSVGYAFWLEDFLRQTRELLSSQ